MSQSTAFPMNRLGMSIGIAVVVTLVVLLSGSAVLATGDQAPLAQEPTPPPPTPPTPPWYPYWYGYPWWGNPWLQPYGQQPFGPQSSFTYYSWNYQSTPLYAPWFQPYPFRQGWDPYPQPPVW
jgi:hypothetical protein